MDDNGVPEETAAKPEYLTGMKVFLVILGIVLLLPGACGGLFMGGMMAQWVEGGGDFNDPYAPLVVVVASVSFLGSMFLFGLLLRVSRWPLAPKFSLAAAIASAVCLMVTLLTLVDDFDSSQPDEQAILWTILILGFLLSVVAPIQFWASRRRIEDAEQS